ncbi:MAG: hypothetical protein ACREPT_08540 [Rudaea sp.]
MTDQLPATGVRVALLNQGAELKSGLRRALVMLGADIVYEASAGLLDRAQLTTSGARVIVVNLGADDAPVRKIQDLLDVGDYEIVINDIETAAQLGDAEQLRWARLLVGKILQRPDFDLPPRPQGAEAVPGSAPLRASTAVQDAPVDAPTDSAAVTAPDWSLAPLHENEAGAATGESGAANEFGIETIPAYAHAAAKGGAGMAGHSSDIDLDFDLIPLEAEAEGDPIARELADTLRERARTHAQQGAAPPATQPPDKPRKK